MIMLKSKLYRLISVFCSICFLANFCGVLQIPTAYAAGSISLTLKYVDNTGNETTTEEGAQYKSTGWGTITFCSSEAGDYADLSTITPTPAEESDNKYSYKLTKNDHDSVYIKIPALANGVTAAIGNGDGTPTLIDSGKTDPLTLTTDATITFTKEKDSSDTNLPTEKPYFIWAYKSSDEDLPQDYKESLEKFIVKGGTVSITPSEGIEGTATPEDGGAYMIANGTPVTITLTPNYGNQIINPIIESMDVTQTQANGEKIAIQEIELTTTENDTPCTYTFIMPDHSIILGNPFTASADRVNATASSIKNAVITNPSEIINSGNYSMDVIDAVLPEDTKKTLLKTADTNGLTPISYLDIELSNFFSKASTNENDIWEEPITSLTTPAKITLTLSQPESGKTYKIFKFDDQNVSEINTNYDASNGSVSFEIADFSSLMLAEGNDETKPITDDGTSNTSSSDSSKTNTPTIKTGDNNCFLTYSTLMLMSALGYIASFKFKNKRNVIWF